MKRKINCHIKSIISVLFAFSTILFTSPFTSSLELENLDSQNESLNIKSTSIDSYVKFGKCLGVKPETLQNKLTLNIDDKEYKLVPLDNIEEHKSFLKKLFTFCDEKYMKFYGNGKRLTEKTVENNFQGRLKRMWGKGRPNSMTLIVKINQENVGMIAMGPLRTKNVSPEIAYVIDQDSSGKGIGTKSVKLAVRFLQYLKDEGIYNFKCLKATAHPDNIGSNKILSNVGFTTDNKIRNFSYGKRKLYKYNFS